MLLNRGVSVGGGSALTFTYVGGKANTSSQSTSSLDVSSISIQAGDLILVLCRIYDTVQNPALSGDADITGFTQIDYRTNSASALYALYKLSASGSESTLTFGVTTSLAGAAAVVYRPSRPIASIAINDIEFEITSGNPTSKTLNLTNATRGPVVGLGFSVGFGNWTPTSTGTDGLIQEATGNDTYMYYKKYNSVPTANMTWDMPDAGNFNCLYGMYYTFT